MSRLASATATKVVSTDRPFSSFAFTEANFAGTPPIRRLFSLARGHGARTLVLEDIPATEEVDDENQELAALAPDYQMADLKRVSFWNESFTEREAIGSLTDGHCLGYALLKRDIISSQGVDRWHVFEAVFVQNPHEHNYCPADHRFPFRAGDRDFTVRGCLYAQQNNLNKACAQVALRSLCATYLGDAGLTYRRINDLASDGDPGFNPADGLDSVKIAKVLKGLGIPFFDLNYLADPTLQKDFPYQKLVYSGIESGCGSLLAFKLSGPSAPDVGHIIPCFGHTFNEDAWGPHADVMYFTVGAQIAYVPSRAWTSSFIVHDDNLGANLCIPQSFVKDENAGYAVELLPRGYAYSGALAEIVASDYFYSLLPAVFNTGWGNLWVNRLIHYVNDQRLILRCVPITVKQYLEFLRSAEDWEHEKENIQSLEDLTALKPDKLWMVEVSVPEVFSTNKRKLGEILLDAENPLSDQVDGTSFVLARFPECYVFFDSISLTGQPSFLTSPSNFKSHLPLLTR
jgi:hypothetical protein